MTVSSIQQLSSELQDLQLKNNQWLSGIIFLENETRFIHKLCIKVLKGLAKDIQFHKIQHINARLNDLEKLKDQLKTLVPIHEQLHKTLTQDIIEGISVKKIQDYKEIMTEINVLFNADSRIKKELYTLLDQLIMDDKVKQLINTH